MFKNSAHVRRWSAVGLSALLVAGIVYLGAELVRQARVAGLAERRLHAALCVSDVLEAFVTEFHRWPQSYSELQRFSPASEPRGMYDWPNDAPQVMELVDVEFGLELNEFPLDDPTAVISARGPCYEYETRIESLVTTIRSLRNQGAEGNVQNDGIAPAESQ